MRYILILIFSFLSLKSFAFTLNNNAFAAFAEDDVILNMASTTDCSATGLTNDEILSLAQEAGAIFWNKVASSRVRIRQGQLTSVSSSFATGLICSSGSSSSCVPNSALKVDSGILIACNTNAANFSNSSYVMAVALPNNISGATISGGLVLLNATGTTATNALGKLSREEKIATIAHEIGHALGMGHSAVKDSLMYYQTVQSRVSLGWDDIQGITYLYPKEQPISCSSISNKSNNLPLYSAFFFLTFMLLTSRLTKVLTPRHR